MNPEINLEEFIKGLPKAELHVHVEGTLEPELMFRIASENNIVLSYYSVAELKKAYIFNNLQDFLDIYYEGSKVLVREKDFYDLTLNYLEKAHSQNVLHTEMFFDPQTHTARGVPFGDVIKGIYRAVIYAERKYGLSAKIIMCFRRDLDAVSALKTLTESFPYRDMITAVGLDSFEKGNPAAKFKEVFRKAQDAGYLCVAHAGEEGSADYVSDALHVLNVSRIDHGNHSLEDNELVKELVSRKVPLTICPLSNLKLNVVTDLKAHPLKMMMEKGMLVTIHSDDPAYFGGYINKNYIEISRALGLNSDEIYQLAKNSFLASFIGDSEKDYFIKILDDYMKKFK